ncbi:hypothetical protein KY359_01795 [Candidatus Woesearchaeota archaeon]|nr:hypothetical protein [Candidatus Woesearchaeota archaeon]
MVSKYQVNMYIAYSKVLVESAMLFPEGQTVDFTIDLPHDAREITNEVDKFEYPAIIDSNSIRFHLKENKYVKYSYITDELTEDESFIASLTVPFDTDVMRVQLALPETATLDKPVRKNALSGSAIYPKPKGLSTDGQVITVVWEFEDLKKGEEVALYAKYRKPARYWIPTIIIVLAVLVIAGGASYLFYRSNGKRKGKKEAEKNQEKAFSGSRSHDNSVDKHLKEDEQQIINVLRLKEGRCEQGTLRIATGFSKAKLSGLLKEMEQRKVVHKEKRGKKNLVFLKD